MAILHVKGKRTAKEGDPGRELPGGRDGFELLWKYNDTENTFPAIGLTSLLQSGSG